MRALITSVLALCVSISLLAQTASVVQDQVANSEAMYYFHQRKVARSSTGTLMVVWLNLPSSTGGGQVQYSVYDPAFGTWSPPAAVSSAPDRARQPALAADESGNIHCVWMQTAAAGGKNQLFYSKYNGTSWSSPVQISVAASVRAEEETIEVGRDGTIWVVYNNDGEGAGNEWLFAVKSTDGGATWSANADTLSKGGTFGSSIEVGRAQIAPGTGGKMVVIWDNSLTGTLARREVFMNLYNGSSWQGEMKISDTTSVDRDHNRYVAVAADPQDNIYAFYTLPIVSGTDPRLSHIVVHKNAWADPWDTTYTLAIDSSTANYLDVSAVADSDGVVHISYRRDMVEDTAGLDEIVYRYSATGGASWSDPVVVSRPRHDGGYSSLANRVRTAYGIDIAWRESADTAVSDQAVQAVMYGNVPYNISAVGHDPLPGKFLLEQNYPNPFNPSTALRFELARRDHVTLGIYDALGRQVRILVAGLREAGSYTESWDGTDAGGARVSSGVYYSRLGTSQGVQSIKMVLIK